MTRNVINVLLVEDDADDVLITRNLLSRAGPQRFQVSLADCLRKAVAQLDDAAFDVILLDLSLPDSQGWDTLTRMLGAAPEISIVLLTGLEDETMGIKAVQEGAQDYLFKGAIDPNSLARAIRYAIERKHSELHGGRMKLHSPPPGRSTGTEVEVRLPKSSPPHVLVVDDCRITRDMVAAQLNQQGYVVTAGANGREALVALERQHPDIIITDLVMPVLDGVGMIAEIKSHPRWRHIPIIAITGGELDRTKREILEGFAIPALAKPWRQEILLDLIENTVFGMRYLNTSFSL